MQMYELNFIKVNSAAKVFLKKNFVYLSDLRKGWSGILLFFFQK